MRNILLNKNISKESVNEVNIVPIELNRDISLLQDEILTDTIDTMEVYNKEKDECVNHRFIFTLYPLCTNVLCNKITEIVKDEGSDNCSILNTETTPTRINAISNTEYSNDYTYHCGVDIFNNHLLRKKEDIYIEDYKGNKDSKFNTINDVYRTGDKKQEIQIIVPIDLDKQWYDLDKISKKSLPVYQFDTIKSFYEAYNTNLKKENGFIGFNNPSTIPIFLQNEKYYINKCINNLENCQFVDLYPERDLFYFTPKINQYRKRVEYNWDYYLSYPSENVYDGNFLDNNVNGLPLIGFDNDSTLYKKQYGPNGLITLLFRCACKHNLNIRDSIRLKFIGNIEKDNQNEIFYKEVICNIANIGENGKYKEYYFSIIANDVKNVIDITDIVSKDTIITDNNNVKITQIRFSKVVSGYECKYYFRKFKEIQLLDGDDNVKLKNTLNKLAFANTIYGEDVSQLVYTDSVNIMELKDNLGRPLTEIYLTFIKTNRGYNEWYNSKDYTSKKVEYSHVFGKVTSGLDLPSYVKDFNISFPTVRGQHNIKLDGVDNDGNYRILLDDGSYIVLNPSSGYLEDDIIRNESENILYGDLVEFNPITLNEIVLEKVKHRFNTYQRELTGDNSGLYNTIHHEEITRDFYDVNGKNDDYTIATEMREINKGFANLGPEGYIYEPHYKVKIGEFDEIVKQASDILISINNNTFTLYEDKDNNEYLEFSTKINYGILPGDLISYCNKDGSNLKKYRVFQSYIDVIYDNIAKKNVTIFYFICGNINNTHENFKYQKVRINDISTINDSQKIILKQGDKINNNLLINNNLFKYIISGMDVYQIIPNDILKSDIVSSKNYSFFQHNLEIPEYAYMLPDGTGRHLWREIKKPSTYNFNSDLYNVPFTNGAFYHQTNILFPVKRQDPKREYGMFLRQGNGNGPIIENNFEISSDKFDISSEEYIDNTIGQTCF